VIIFADVKNAGYLEKEIKKGWTNCLTFTSQIIYLVILL